MATTAAFFDLDRTLMAGSSAMHFGRAAYRAGMVSRRQLAKDLFAHLQFRLQGSTDQTTEELLKRIQRDMKGVRRRDLERLSPEVLAGVLPRIYPQMLDEVYEHRDAGRLTFIVSAAAHGLVELLAQVLVMDGGIGTRYEIDGDGAYTGFLDGPFTYGEGKVEAMNRVAAEHGIHMAGSFAYSDSASDLPMLRAVGNPVAVNPDTELEDVAKREGWRIMRFEKLGRRLAVAGAVATAAALGGSGSLLARRRTRLAGRSGLRRR